MRRKFCTYIKFFAQLGIIICYGSNCDLPFDSGVEKPVDLEADDLYALRYKSIKPLVENGQVDLV